MPPTKQKESKDPFKSVTDDLLKATRKGDIISKLNEIHKCLVNLGQEQSEHTAGLRAASNAVISQGLLNHSDRDVRLLSVSCCVDVLRVYAPEAPYSDEEMVNLFDIITSLLRGLANYDATSSAGVKVLYILSSLSTVKSCVVPVILAASGVKGAQDVVTSMFDALITSIRADHSEEILGHISDIIQACIEECDEVDQEILDTLLQPLLPAAKVENPTAYKVVCNILRRVTGHIQASVSTFANRVLVGTSIAIPSQASELNDHIYPLVYELHKITPGLLLRVLPNICIQLLTEEVEIRLKAVKLLSRLFASQYAEYGTDFSRSFKDFLGRFIDASVEIRVEMLDSCLLIMKRKPALRKQIEEHVVKRLKDSDFDVRFKALNILLEVALDDPCQLAFESFQEMGQRATDKKPEIRKLLLSGLARIYSKHVVTGLPAISAVLESGISNLSDIIPKDIWTRLRFVPGFVVKNWGFPEIQTKHQVVLLLQEYLLPKWSNHSKKGTLGNSSGSQDDGASASQQSTKPLLARPTKDQQTLEDIEAQRVTALLLMFISLDANDMNSLSTILGFKAKVRYEVSTFLQTRNNDLEAAAPGISPSLRRSMMNLLQAVPLNDRKSGLLERLHGMKDKRIFKLLATSCHACTDWFVTTYDNREDLKQRVDSKSALGEYIGVLHDFASYSIVNAHTINELVKSMTFLIRDRQENGDSQGNILAQVERLLHVLTKHNPLTCCTSAPHMEAWLLACFDGMDANRNKSTANQRYLDSLVISCTKLIEFTASSYSFSSSAMEELISHRPKSLPVEARSSSTSSSSSTGSGPQSSDKLLESRQSLCTTMIDFASKTCNDTSISSSLADAAAQILLSSSTGSDLNTSTGSQFLPDVASFITSFASPSNLSISKNHRLPFQLAVLASFAKIPTPILRLNQFVVVSTSVCFMNSTFSDYVVLRDELLSFFKDQMISSDRAEDLTDKSMAAAKKKQRFDFAKIVGAGLQAWAYMLSAEMEMRDTAAAATTTTTASQSAGVEAVDAPIDKKRPSKRAGKDKDNATKADGFIGSQGSLLSKLNTSVEISFLIELLSGCIISSGAMLNDLLIESQEAKDHLLHVASTLFFHMLKVKSIGSNLSVAHWQYIAWRLVDSPEATKSQLLDILSKIVQTTITHPKYLAYYCLLANDEHLKSKAENILLFAVKRLRSTHEEMCGRALSEDNENIRRLAEESMPEIILPYALHLLSYHPEFPSSLAVDTEADKKRVANVVRCIRMILKALFDSLSSDADNLSYLYKQTTVIFQRYEDNIDPNNIGLQFVARITIRLLQEQLKTVENFQSYPGNIFLPGDLYKLKSSDPSAGSVDVNEIDLAIDGIFGKLTGQLSKNVGGKGTSHWHGHNSAAAGGGVSKTSPAARGITTAKQSGRVATTVEKDDLLASDNSGSDDDDDDDDSNSNDIALNNKRSVAAGNKRRVAREAPIAKPISSKSSKSIEAKEEPVKERILPRRAVTTNVNYSEKAEDMTEALEWDHAAAAGKKVESDSVERRNSKERQSASRGATSAADDEPISASKLAKGANNALKVTKSSNSNKRAVDVEDEEKEKDEKSAKRKRLLATQSASPKELNATTQVGNSSGSPLPAKTSRKSSKASSETAAIMMPPIRKPLRG